MNKIKSLIKTPQGAAGAVSVAAFTLAAVTYAFMAKKGLLEKDPSVMTDLPKV